jgi:hypothetical protein
MLFMLFVSLHGTSAIVLQEGAGRLGQNTNTPTQSDIPLQHASGDCLPRLVVVVVVGRSVLPSSSSSPASSNGGSRG